MKIDRYEEVNKVIVISDLHLGNDECVLFKNNCHLLEKLIGKLKEEAGTYELIILGDLLELSLAPELNVFLCAKYFFNRISALDNIRDIIYLPGNHDHHIWTEITIDHLPSDKLPPAGINLTLTDEIYDDVQFLIRRFGVENLKVAYPNLLREIHGKKYLFHHGHLKHFCQSAISGKCYGNIKEVEEVNKDFMDFLWSHEDSIEVFLAKIGNKIWDSTLNIYSALRGGKARGEEEGEHLSEELSEYLTLCDKEYEDKFDSFVYGHTHVAHGDKEFDFNGRRINICNTGGWTDYNNSCYVAIDSNGTRLVRI
jgi:UDP-2,3-diacylglucosamine pyrophosphatase LpxH